MRIHPIHCASLALIAAIVAAAPASAQEATAAAAQAAPAQQAATLAQAREGALALSRTLRKALLAADAAKLATKAQPEAMLPGLSASASASLPYGASGSASSAAKVALGLSASQTIYDGGRNAALVAIDAIGETAAREAARSAYFAAAKEAEQAYYAALEAYAAEEAARNNLESSRIHLQLASAKLEAGMIARPAYLEVESEYATKETALNSARKASLTASRKLASLTGLAVGAKLADEDGAAVEALAARVAALDDAGAEGFAAALLAAAAKDNPDLAQAALAAAKAEGEVSYAKKAGLPTVSAAWSHGASYSESGLNLLSGSLSLTASLPIEPWAVASSVAQKKAAADEAALARDDERSTMELDLWTAVYSAVSNARAIASSKKALEYAEGNYENQLEAFRLSSLSSSALSDAEALVASARSLLIAARYSFLSGLAELRAIAALESEAALEAALP